jgi:hypothetical protein
VSQPKKNAWTTPVEINDAGTRIVVETTYENGERCQMIFVRVADGWTLTLCAPGVLPINLPAEHANRLSYGLRQATAGLPPLSTNPTTVPRIGEAD